MSHTRTTLIVFALLIFMGGFGVGLIVAGKHVEKLFRLTSQQSLELREENANLREQIKILEQMVATQRAQLDEINAVIGPQEVGEIDLDSIKLEVTTEPRGAVDLPARYDLIDVVDERPGADQ